MPATGVAKRFGELSISDPPSMRPHSSWACPAAPTPLATLQLSEIRRRINDLVRTETLTEPSVQN